MMIKLTKAKTKEFFKLIKNQEISTYNETMTMLNVHPELSNAVVSGIAKGIDGYSSLMLAVRFLNFKFALDLIKKGADVNFIEDTDTLVRTNFRLIFIDLLNALSNCVHHKNIKKFEEGLKVWDLMESYGLDYSKKTIVTDGVNQSENCVQAYIRLVNVQYGHSHKIHFEANLDYSNSYYLRSEKSRDLEKEKMYELGMEKLVACIDEELFKEIDANKHRNSGNLFLDQLGKSQIIDDFGLEIANKFLTQKFGHPIKNMNDSSILKDYPTEFYRKLQ